MIRSSFSNQTKSAGIQTARKGTTDQMNCPHCKKLIDRHDIAAHLGRAGGLKRTPLTEAQKAEKRASMERAREKRWAKKKKESDNDS